jgi:hypothetical protein
MSKDTSFESWIATKRGPKKWRADDGARVIKEWKASGLSMAAFARQHEIDAQRVRWWRDRAPAKSSALTLVPVTVRESMFARTNAVVSIAVGGDVRVDVDDPSRVAPLWFAAVIDALSRRPA